jgi:hypothetical protein
MRCPKIRIFPKEPFCDKLVHGSPIYVLIFALSGSAYRRWACVHENVPNSGVGLHSNCHTFNDQLPGASSQRRGKLPRQCWLCLANRIQRRAQLESHAHALWLVFSAPTTRAFTARTQVRMGFRTRITHPQNLRAGTSCRQHTTGSTGRFPSVSTPATGALRFAGSLVNSVRPPSCTTLEPASSCFNLNVSWTWLLITRGLRELDLK